MRILARWRALLGWLGAILIMVLATVFYQPAAAKTGSLLVWLNQKIYVMDIDTLLLEPVGPAEADERLVPSPGCAGLVEAPCRVVAGPRLYTVYLSPTRPANQADTLPLGDDGFSWPPTGAASWSPDGQWLAYPAWSEPEQRAELRLYRPDNGETRLIAPDINPAVAPTWHAACANGPTAAGCRLAFQTGGNLTAVDLSTDQRQTWPLTGGPVAELAWTAAGQLLFSRPKRHFYFADDQSPAYQIPQAAQLANLSPQADYAVYYQPFHLKDGCAACLQLGVWLTSSGQGDNAPRLIYNMPVAGQTGGLNFVPVWSPGGESFVFFQDGQLIYYDLPRQEAVIWYKEVGRKLRSAPVFAPHQEAVALVDNAGQGLSEYRLLVIDPRLQPVEHIIQTQTGFRVLAWLPD